MGNYLIALVYSLAAIALVGVAVVTDSLKRSHSFQPLTASATQSRDKSAELQGIIESNLEFGIFAVDKNQHASLSADNSTKNSSGFEPLEFAKQLVDNVFQKRQENFTFDPKSEQSKYPEWIPAEIRNGWIFLATALLLSLAATVFILGPERIQKKWNRWVTWYEHSEHVRVGLLYPQLPIHIANGVFSVVSPIFILRVLQLDFALLAAFVFAEHAVQVLVQAGCSAYVDSAGHKAAHMRAVYLFIAVTFLLVAVPFVPDSVLYENRWFGFGWFAVARMLWAWGTAQFEMSYTTAINNSAFLPPVDMVKTANVAYLSEMLGAVIGTVASMAIDAFTGAVTWSLLALPLVVTVMLAAVRRIRDDKDNVTFPPDPANEAHVRQMHDEIKSKRSRLSKSTIWSETSVLAQLLHFVALVLLFAAMQGAFPFLLPLAGMGMGMSDGDVAFLLAVSPMVGLVLFWLGSAYDHVDCVTKGSVAATGFAVAYTVAFFANGFAGLYLACLIFALTACYCSDLMQLLRICYLHSASRKGHKDEFVTVSDYSSHLAALNAPLLVLAAHLRSIPAAFAAWGLLSLATVLWILLGARGSVEEVTRLERVHEDEALQEEAEALFKEMDTDGDGVLTSEEILSFLERKEVGRGMLGRGAMLSSIIRLADRDGEGTVSPAEFRRAYAAINHLLEYDAAARSHASA